MTAKVVQLGILGQQLLGIVGQIEGRVVGHGLDAQELAYLHDSIERGAAHAVMEGAVNGGQGYAYCKGKLPHAPVLPRDLLAHDGRQIIHDSSSASLKYIIQGFPIISNYRQLYYNTLSPLRQPEICYLIKNLIFPRRPKNFRRKLPFPSPGKHGTMHL